MPSPLEHLSIGLGVLSETQMAHPGEFLAGVVAPDIDKLLGWPRERTHWWLSGTDVSGALRLAASRPRIVHCPRRSEAQAFVAGYLCHLVTDEQWTLHIYREHFGRHSPFAGSRHGADHQLALQVALDTRLVTSGVLAPAINALSEAKSIDRLARIVLGEDGKAVGTFVASVLRRAVNPDAIARLRQMASDRESERLRLSGSQHEETPETATGRSTDTVEGLESFLARLPDLSRAGLEMVSMAEVDQFRRHATESSVLMIRELEGGLPLTPPRGTAPEPYFASPARTDL